MRKKLTLLLFVLLLGTNLTKAQNWANGIDDDWFNWGYSFQYISAEYKLWKNPNWKLPFNDPSSGMQVTDTLSSILSQPMPGFAIGFVANRKITNNFDVRLTPSLVFSDRKISYTYFNGEHIERKVSSTMIDVPLSLKLKSDRLMNFRGYMIGGVKYSIGMASKKNGSNPPGIPELDKKPYSKKSFLSYEAGAGMDFYFGFFKMSTELKVSQSFKDILIHENNAFAMPIEKAKLRHFTFSLFFE